MRPVMVDRRLRRIVYAAVVGSSMGLGVSSGAPGAALSGMVDSSMLLGGLECQLRPRHLILTLSAHKQSV